MLAMLFCATMQIERFEPLSQISESTTEDHTVKGDQVKDFVKITRRKKHHC
jgi:hypothetical protein